MTLARFGVVQRSPDGLVRDGIVFVMLSREKVHTARCQGDEKPSANIPPRDDRRKRPGSLRRPWLTGTAFGRHRESFARSLDPLPLLEDGCTVTAASGRVASTARRDVRRSYGALRMAWLYRAGQGAGPEDSDSSGQRASLAPGVPCRAASIARGPLLRHPIRQPFGVKGGV